MLWWAPQRLLAWETSDRSEHGWSRDTSKSGMFRPPPCHSVLLRSFVSSRPAFSHGRRLYAQLKVDKTAEDFNKLSTGEQLERLTKLNASADNNPDVDLWSLNADLLGRWFDTKLYVRSGFDSYPRNCRPPRPGTSHSNRGCIAVFKDPNQQFLREPDKSFQEHLQVSLEMSYDPTSVPSLITGTTACIG